MTRVLLTGGSGFIAAHCLETLLERGHSVVTTVRSQEKADKIREAHPQISKSQLDFAIVEDIAKPEAFSKAVVSDPPFEAVIHTASPFHFNADDIQKDLLDPAIKGTRAILGAIEEHAPTVKRLVVTSSFASIINGSKGSWPEHTYTEQDWSPLTLEQALESQSNGYRASKKFAEKAAWEFEDKEKPAFTIATINPPLVLGPIIHYLNSLDAVNTSNQRVRDLMLGKWRDEIADTGTFAWVDVRDVAEAHVKAMELADAADTRFFVTAGNFCNRELADILKKNFPDYASKAPSASTKGGDYPEGGVYRVDNSRSVSILGMKYRSLEESITDLIKSLQAAGA